MQVTSRKYEYEADEYAAKTISEPEEMVDVLKKLSKDNLSNLTPHPFYVCLNYSHPPVLKRIERIRMGQIVGKQRIRAVMLRIRVLEIRNTGLTIQQRMLLPLTLPDITTN